MNILIVHESLFGNTHAVALAIADGMREGRGPADDHVRVVRVDEAPTTLDDIDLLVVGGPTHAFSMTRPQTRADAAMKGAPVVRSGIREWIDTVAPRPDLSVVTFDTRVHVRLMPGSAAGAAAKMLRHRGFSQTQRGESFWVSGTPGPLADGEIERAQRWGATLPASVRHGVG